MPLINLTPELQAAASPVLQAAQPAQPTAPEPNLPIASGLPPASPDALDQTAPAQPTQPVPFSQAISNNTDAASAAAPPAAAQQPGHWARSLVAGALKSLPSAVQNIQNEFGDAAVANLEAKPGMGMLDRMGLQARAKAERQQQAQTAKTEQEKNQAATAYSNILFHRQQLELHQLQGEWSDKANNAAVEAGKRAVEIATTGAPEHGAAGAPIIATDVDESQLPIMMKNKTFDPQTQTPWETSVAPVLDSSTGTQQVDKDGQPVFKKLYTIVGTPPKVAFSRADLNTINSALGTKYPDGTIFPGALGILTYQRAQSAIANKARIASDAEAAGIKQSELDREKGVLDAQKSLSADPDFQKASSHLPDLQSLSLFVTGQLPTGKLVPEIVNGKPTGRNIPQIDPQSLDYAKAHPDGLSALKNSYGFTKDGESVYQKVLEDQRDKADAAQVEAEKERHDRALEAQALKTEQDKKTADLNDQTDAFGNTSPLPQKEFNKRYDSFTNSQQNKTIQTLQGSYQQFNSILNDVNQGKLTPAEDVVGLLAAIGISATPLAGKGFRINSNIIDEHVGAQVGGPNRAKLLQLTTGDILSAQQLQDYGKIAADVYKQSYLNAAAEQRRTLGYVDILPRGNNQQIDPMTASMYLQTAGNNPQLAAQAAQKQGWQATPQNFVAPSGKAVSLASAMALPVNKGKTAEQVRADIVAHGHEVGQ